MFYQHISRICYRYGLDINFIYTYRHNHKCIQGRRSVHILDSNFSFWMTGQCVHVAFFKARLFNFCNIDFLCWIIMKLSLFIVTCWPASQVTSYYLTIGPSHLGKTNVFSDIGNHPLWRAKYVLGENNCFKRNLNDTYWLSRLHYFYIERKMNFHTVIFESTPIKYNGQI